MWSTAGAFGCDSANELFGCRDSQSWSQAERERVRYWPKPVSRFAAAGGVNVEERREGLQGAARRVAFLTRCNALEQKDAFKNAVSGSLYGASIFLIHSLSRE